MTRAITVLCLALAGVLPVSCATIEKLKPAPKRPAPAQPAPQPVKQEVKQEVRQEAEAEKPAPAPPAKTEHNTKARKAKPSDLDGF